MRAISGHDKRHSILKVPVRNELLIEDENGGVEYKTSMIPNATFSQFAGTRENI